MPPKTTRASVPETDARSVIELTAGDSSICCCPGGDKHRVSDAGKSRVSDTVRTGSVDADGL